MPHQQLLVHIQVRVGEILAHRRLSQKTEEIGGIDGLQLSPLRA